MVLSCLVIMVVKFGIEMVYYTEKMVPLLLIMKCGIKMAKTSSKWQKHREDGSTITQTNGEQEWWINGERHREDGPSLIFDENRQYWHINGILHRENGPAIIRYDDKAYWENGVCLSSTNWMCGIQGQKQKILNEIYFSENVPKS